MKLHKCFFCNKITHTPIRLTDVKEDGSVEVFKVCVKCGNQYQAVNPDDMKPNIEVLDLENVVTVEHLFDLLSIKPKREVDRVCDCGLTETEFDDKGRFGCPQCYTTFADKMAELVFPWHGAKSHEGKSPMNMLRQKWETDPEEKRKVLKLRFAKAIELEDYESAKEIKKELDGLSPEASSDQ